MIACAFKSQISEIRKSIKATEILLKKSKFESKFQILDSYNKGLKKDLLEKSQRLIDIIENECVSVTGHPVPLIFFKKLQADMLRYQAKFPINTNLNEKTTLKERAHKKYREAVLLLKMERDRRINKNETDYITSIRLSLNLNYAVFLYEIDNKKKKALRILK